MDTKKWLKSKSDSELMVEFKALEDSIFNVGCFGTKDMILLHAIGGELQKRGYETEDMRTFTKWAKKK